VRLEGEVAGVEEAHVSVWNVTLERLGARRQEKRVVLAPSCQTADTAATEKTTAETSARERGR
jgi:sRNA-binding protein